MDDKVKTLHTLYSSQQTFCQEDVLSGPAWTFCQDRFMHHFSHADRLRRFVRTVLRVVTGGYESLWAAMDDYGVVTGDYR